MIVAEANKSALVLFSGGQDSTTCLAFALDRFDRVETVGFDYGQRHRVELAQRSTIRANLLAIAPQWERRLGNDHTIDLAALGQISDTSLTDERTIAFNANGLPNTFVPGRNLIFLTFAAALAYRRGLTVIVGGMCETDFSGYPDCRDDAVKAHADRVEYRHGKPFRSGNAVDVARQGANLDAGAKARRRRHWSISSSRTRTPAIWASADDVITGVTAAELAPHASSGPTVSRATRLDRRELLRQFLQGVLKRTEHGVGRHVAGSLKFVFAAPPIGTHGAMLTQ